MRKCILLSLFFFLTLGYGFAQIQSVEKDKTVTLEQIKNRFLIAPSSEWNALFEQFKKEIADSVVDNWRNDAIAFNTNRDYEQAHKLADVCVHLATIMHHQDLLGKSLLVKAEIFYNESNDKSAIDFATRAATSLLAAGDKFQLGRAKHRLGLIYFAIPDLKKSIQAFEESIVIKKQLLASEPENKTYNESLYVTYDKYGDALYKNKNYDQEIEANKAALALSKKYNKTNDIAYMQYCIAWTYSRAKNQPKDAIPFFEGSIEAYLIEKDTSFILYNYEELIKAREALNDHEGARADGVKAVRLAVAEKGNRADALRFINAFIKRYKDDSNLQSIGIYYSGKESLYAKHLDTLVLVKTDYAEFLKSKADYDNSIKKYKEILTLPVDEATKADTYWNMALVYEGAKNYRAEVESFRKAIPYYADDKNKHNQIILLSNIGITYRNAGDSINAYKVHDEAIALVRKKLDTTDPSHAYVKAVETYDHFGSHKKKLELLLEVYALYRTMDQPAKTANFANLLGKEYESAFLNFDKAEEYYRQSAELYNKAKDLDGEATEYWNIAYNLGENKKDYRTALSSYAKAEEIFGYLKDTVSWKTIISNTAINYRILKDSTHSYLAHQRAINLCLPNSDPENLIYAYTKAIDTYDRFNNHKKKRELLLKKYELYKKIGDEKNCGSMTQTIGKEYQQDPKDIKLATHYFNLGLEHYKKAQDKDGLANNYWNIGFHTDVHLKKYKEAIINYDKAIALFAELKDTASWKTLLVNEGIIYKEHMDSINSYKAFDKAIVLTLHNSDQEQLAYVYKTAAESYAEFGNYGKQKAVLMKQLAVRQKLNDHLNLGKTYKAIAKMYEDGMRNYSEADTYYQKAIAEFDQTTDLDAQGDAYWNFGYNKKEKLNDYPVSLKAFEKAYTIFIQNKDSSNASVMRSNVAQTYWSMEDFERAILNHKLAIEIATKSKNKEMIAKSWNALADLYKKTDNPVKSKESLANAIVALEALNDSTQLAKAYTSIASSYSKSKDYTKSYEFYEKAVKLRKILKDSSLWASALYDWGNAYYDKRDYVPAGEKYKASLAIYQKLKDKSNQVYCLISLASIEQFNNDYKKAEVLFNQSLVLAKALNDEIVLAYCYSQMKELYRSTGRSDLADDNSLKALEMYKKLGNWKQVSYTLSSLAYDYYYVYGSLDKALDYYDQAQAIADTLSDKSALAGIIEGRATVYEERGEFAKALENIDKSYEIYKSVYNEWGIAGTYIDRGNVYKSISEYATAMKFQYKADSMYLKMGTEYARLAPLANIGGNYSAMGNYQKGLEFTMKAYEIMKNAGDMNTNLCIIKGNIGDTYYYLNNFPESDKWLKDALETSKKVGAKRPMIDILGELGRLKIDEKKYTEADQYLSLGMKMAKESGLPMGYLNNQILMGKLQVETKQFDKAKLTLDEAYKTCVRIGKDNSLWEALYLLGLLNKNSGNLSQSRDYLKESVKIIEKIRNKVTGGEEAQKLFSSDKNIIKVYEALVEVLLALGQTEDAMTYIQKNNDDNLKAKFKTMDVKFENEDKNKVVYTERSMKAKLDGIEDQIQKEKSLHLEKQNTAKLKNLQEVKTIAESEYIKFVQVQVTSQPELSKFFNNSVQPTDFRKIKRKIPKDMALLSYLAGENQLYIFAATTDTVIAKIVNVPRAQLIKDINGMLNIIRTNMGSFAQMDLKTQEAERKEIVDGMKQSDPMIKPFEDAYHYLIAPIAKEIAGKSRLGVIPTGALNYIPFQMLGKTLENGKFSLMMNQFAIFYVNSTDMLFNTDAVGDKNFNILAFGNPDKSLPSTEKEVNDIKKLYPNTAVYLREEATEDKAKYANESYNIMHFATHGTLDYEDFTNSFLTMANNPAKSEDGKLTLSELWGMEVMTHLNIVVLSACETAVTKGSNESSAVSPASGFLQNGVKSVVATLWKVDDEATSILITDFYRNIKTMDSVDALRAAQVSLSNNKKFAHPYYWAAVVLIGDWR